MKLVIVYLMNVYRINETNEGIKLIIYLFVCKLIFNEKQ